MKVSTHTNFPGLLDESLYDYAKSKVVIRQLPYEYTSETLDFLKLICKERNGAGFDVVECALLKEVYFLNTPWQNWYINLLATDLRKGNFQLLTFNFFKHNT